MHAAGLCIMVDLLTDGSHSAYVKPNPEDTSGPGVPVPDASIPRGVQWLIGAIQKDLDALERRTQADTAAWREQEAQRKVAWTGFGRRLLPV